MPPTSRRTFCSVGCLAIAGGFGAFGGESVPSRQFPVGSAGGGASAAGGSEAARRLGAWLSRFAVVESVTRESGRPGDRRVVIHCRRDAALPPERLAAALADRAGAPFDVLRAEGSRLFCVVEGTECVVQLAS